ncbi:hypothetical protein CVT25_011843 [Psilocybe cyanescens]|uniref:Uncharacterized protein n=1 Tax=Psilocybe cyanescens TaxID=93625 RepID=A0A409WJ55_PSICY|nr:hypothetical protein CVT25_011843 [Psilocybe cyanescens]
MLHRLRFYRPKIFSYCLYRPIYLPGTQPYPHRFTSSAADSSDSRSQNAEASLSNALATLANLPEYRLKDINVVKKVIKQAAATSNTPHVVYEGVLNFFISTSRTSQALFVMQRMEALGYTLLNQTLAKMMVLVSAAAEDPPEDCVHLILEIVREEGYTEENLRDLLQTISSYAIDKEKSAQTLFVEAFREARGGMEYQPPLKMLPTFVAAAVRADKLDDAFGMLTSYLNTTKHLDRASRSQIFTAWLAFLKALRETRAWDVASYARVLNNMSAHQVSVNIKLFDQVIAHEARLEDWSGAFQVYGTLRALSRLDKGKEKRGTWEKPMRISSSTFATLFKTYSDMDRSRTHGFGGGVNTKQGILPPRALFKDFTTVFNPSPSETTTRIYHSSQLMHVILRAFIHRVDYAGALLVLRTFANNGMQLTHLTYYIVVKALIERIWYEARIGRPSTPSPSPPSGGGESVGEGNKKKTGKQRKEKTTWASRFLGISTKPLLGMKLVNHILFLISRTEFDVCERMYPVAGEKFRDQEEDEGQGVRGSPSCAEKKGDTQEEEDNEKGGRLCKVPTMLMMEHVRRPKPLDFKYEVLPLERLLSRAIWAVDGVGSEEMVGKAIELAEKEMLPAPSSSSLSSPTPPPPSQSI